MQVTVEVDKFKAEFKRYKQRDPFPDLSNVIEIEDSQNKLTPYPLKDIHSFQGLKPIKEWRAFTLESCPGFIVIQNPFIDGAQTYWIEQCIRTYPNPPNVTNIEDLLQETGCTDIWKYTTAKHPRNELTSRQSLMMKLRWVTLGYHYDWNTKKYYPERHNDFPPDLSNLCKYIATVVGYPDFSPEAAIVNYYHMDSTLAGHTDHSELDHDAPLISISFVQDAIFLIGGLTKETKPEALMLHSGDICIMSGQSRLVYHAVPKILPANSENIQKCVFSSLKADSISDINKCNKCSSSKSCEPRTTDKSCNEEEKNCVTCESCVKCDNSRVTCETKLDFINTNRQANKCAFCSESKSHGQDGDDVDLLREYLKCTRININVRQVLKLNEKFPASDFKSECKKIKLDES